MGMRLCTFTMTCLVCKDKGVYEIQYYQFNLCYFGHYHTYSSLTVMFLLCRFCTS